MLGALSLSVTLYGQDVVIHEIVARGSSFEDEDGATSDWIELRSLATDPVDLSGWHLTDDFANLEKWTFPPRQLVPGEYLIVFASGKDRAGAGPLHCSFQLDGDGETLALVRPDGTVADELSFPEQRRGFSFGTERTRPTTLVDAGHEVRVHVPENDELDLRWTEVAFDDLEDTGWIHGTGGVGFDRDPEPKAAEGLLAFYSFDEAGDSRVALDSSGNDLHGDLVSQVERYGAGGNSRPSFSAPGTGHSGRPGDRSLDLGVSGNGAIVDLPSVADGAFDAISDQDAVSISLWMYGGATQPSGDSLFWAAPQPDGGGVRILNAHAPWSDRVIYWDAGGCCDGSNRIFAPESKEVLWRGAWNHYVFLKDGDRREIWQNGRLFHSGEGPAPLARIQSFVIGGTPTGLSYGGRLDDVAIWSRALSGEEVAQLSRGVSPLSLSSFEPEIGVDVSDEMLGTASSVFVRVPFDWSGEFPAESLLLDVRYDDGFVSFLNGEEILRRNAPEGRVSVNEVAPSERARDEALRWETLDVSPFASRLRVGRNVLAFHVLNSNAADPDLLLVSRLVAAGESRLRFLDPPTPGVANSSGFAGFVGDTEFSVDRGFFDESFEVEISCETPDARIYYTLNGDDPSPESGSLFEEPVEITGTTTLRAVAYADDLYPSNIDTQTYVFVRDIETQAARPPGLPSNWSEGHAADYEMDPDVVSTTQPDYGIEEALRSIPTFSLVLPHDDLWSPSNGIYYNSLRKIETGGSVEIIYPGGETSIQLDAGIRVHGLTSRRHRFTPKHSFRLLFQRQY
ncbi:MAG: lamin tail domain-containing protein, partial [Planctomycetota bacterium]